MHCRCYHLNPFVAVALISVIVVPGGHRQRKKICYPRGSWGSERKRKKAPRRIDADSSSCRGDLGGWPQDGHGHVCGESDVGAHCRNAYLFGAGVFPVEAHAGIGQWKIGDDHSCLTIGAVVAEGTWIHSP